MRDALAEDEKNWEADGATFDPKTMQLESNGRLLVTWEGAPEPTRIRASHRRPAATSVRRTS